MFSEGVLFLDDCDFSESSAPILVEGSEHTVIRNTVLGNLNCETQEKIRADPSWPRERVVGVEGGRGASCVQRYFTSIYSQFVL